MTIFESYRFYYRFFEKYWKTLIKMRMKMSVSIVSGGDVKKKKKKQAIGKVIGGRNRQRSA
jgi:hypothetical protein